MRTRHSEDREAGETKYPLCWSKDAQAQAVRVELADGSFFILPYNHLGFVKFEPGNEADILHIFLSTHDILIRGTNLRELGLAFQKFAVDWIRELPARTPPRAGDEYVWVKSIVVHEV